MKIYDVIWDSRQSGPSTNKNKDTRTEIFLFGCNRAVFGNPCKNCFNPSLWNNEKVKKEYSPEEIVSNIEKHSRNKNITFVGGEPLDQIDDLIKATKLLKERDYHITVFTWRELYKILNNEYDVNSYSYVDKDKMLSLLNNIDILIDGEYKEKEYIFNINKINGLNNAVGSGNQIIWCLRRRIGIEAKYLSSLSLDEDKNLIYYSKDHDKVKIKELKNINKKEKGAGI